MGRGEVEESVLQFGEEVVIGLLLGGDIEELPDLFAVLDGVELGAGVADEGVLILREAFVVVPGLTAEDRDVLVEEIAENLDVGVHLLDDFGERVFDLAGDETVAEREDRGADAVGGGGGDDGSVGDCGAESGGDGLIERLEIGADGCGCGCEGGIVGGLAGEFDEGGGVGLETVEDDDAGVELLGCEQGLHVLVGAPVGVFIVGVDGGVDLLVVAKLDCGAVGVFGVVYDDGGCVGEVGCGFVDGGE